MELEVRFFASLSERVGRSVLSVSVPEDIDVAGLWTHLVLRHPRLADLGFRPLVACDRTWAEWDHPLRAVREVAFLPPLSGG